MDEKGLLGNFKTVMFDKLNHFIKSLPDDKRSKLEKIDFPELVDTIISLIPTFDKNPNDNSKQSDTKPKKPCMFFFI